MKTSKIYDKFKASKFNSIYNKLLKFSGTALIHHPHSFIVHNNIYFKIITIKNNIY